MDKTIVHEVLEQYRAKFEEFQWKEIYKWEALNHFEKHWNLDSPNLRGMFEKALGKAGNLLASPHEYPLQELQHMAEKEPEEVRRLFRNLFNNSQNLESRISGFIQDFRILHRRHTEWEKATHNLRAVMLYLAFQYPETYCLYKFRIFKYFSRLVDLPYKVTSGGTKRIGQYLEICRQLKAEIEQNEDILEIHQKRIDKRRFKDPGNNILVQDVMYAAVRYLGFMDDKGNIFEQYRKPQP